MPWISGSILTIKWKIIPKIKWKSDYNFEANGFRIDGGAISGYKCSPLPLPALIGLINILEQITKRK